LFKILDVNVTKYKMDREKKSWNQYHSQIKRSKNISSEIKLPIFGKLSYQGTLELLSDPKSSKFWCQILVKWIFFSAKFNWNKIKKNETYLKQKK
jgi:hypothetical protein